MYKLIQDCIQVGIKEQYNKLCDLRNDDIALQELFRFMLCPSIVYNIKSIPGGVSNCTHDEIITSASHLVGYLDSLVQADLRGAPLKSAITNIYRHCNSDYKEVLAWVLARKNPAKIGVTAVNSVWPGLIRTQEYMGAIPGTDEALERLFSSPIINAQTKEDGMCLLVEYHQGRAISGRSRQGNDIGKYFPGFMSDLKEVRGFSGMLHIELFCGDSDRAAGNGLINKQIKNGIISGPTDRALTGVLLDLKNSDNLSAPQGQRYKWLSTFETPRLRVVSQTPVKSVEEAHILCQRTIAGGGEGLVLKHPLAPFKNGKQWCNVKMKNEFECSLVCTGVTPHSVRLFVIGSLVMESADRLLRVNVNPRCEEDRVRPVEDWIGNTFRVRAESITTSKTKYESSLYLPRFDGAEYNEYVRIDSGPDDLIKIQESYEMSKHK